MTKSSMSVGLRWQRWQAMLGVVGHVGLLAWAVALALAVLAWLLDQDTRRIDDQTQVLRHDVGAQEASLRAGPLGTRPRPNAAAELFNRDRQGEILAAMERLAVAAPIQWIKADYVLHGASQSTLPSLEINAVVRATYPALRSFIDRELAAQPGAALRALAIQRESPESKEVEARMKWVVYLQPEATP
jgi:hypothetical protein